ncbi:MAG: polA [Candidatus Taylorbacteria bacterium]|nr:polA [Candidatus Taylorbacteria bacterium]
MEKSLKNSSKKGAEKAENRKREKLVLLDSHAILHRAYHALPDFVSAKGEPTGAIYGLVSMLISIIAELKPDYIVACYDLPGPTYRHEVYKEYKAGRAKTDGDLVTQLQSSRKVFEAFNIPIYDKPGFEADDMLGSIVEQILDRKECSDLDVIIASGDMDTMQLISDRRVMVYTLKKGIKDTVLYDEEAVRARFGFGPELLPDYKGLRGDTSDNIIGIKGIGEKTAGTLIGTFGTIENMYKVLSTDAGKKKFEEAGITPRIVKLLEEGKEEAEFSKMLATIRRDAPIEFVRPEKHFFDMVADPIVFDAVMKLFNELNFRTLGPRLKNAIFGKAPAAAKERASEKDEAETDAAESPSNPGNSALFDIVAPEEVKRTGLALWLLDSNLTNPGVEEITNFAQTEDFAKASAIIFSELEKQGLKKLYDTIEMPILPIIERMNARGVKIDRALLAKLSKDYHTQLDRLEKQIHKHAGVEFNINSPKQLGEILFDKLMLTAKGMKKTAGGARSTRESELEKLRDSHPIVSLIFEYREFQKLLSTYIDTIPTLLDEHDRLHSNFIQTGTTTGRMASQSPNLQNIPIRTDLGRAIRGAFIADKKPADGKGAFILGAFDYSQIELRIAAFLSGDEKLIGIFKSGQDVHAAVAAEVFGVPIDKVDREMRRRAKIINFGILYGMGVTALRGNLESEGDVKVTRDEAQKFYNEYFAKFSGLAQYLDKVKAEASRKGYTETFFGRRRVFEGINSKLPYIKAMAERMAINAPIQGTNADVVKIAMKRIDDYIEKEGLRDDASLILQVHDELVYEIREAKAEKIAAGIKEIMETVIDPKDIHGIKLMANGTLGDNWGVLK